MPIINGKLLLCNNEIIESILDSCNTYGMKGIKMPSRASHDSHNFTFCPMGMIFVPSIGGISHSPKEDTSAEMCYNGTKILIDTIKKIDRKIN